MTIRDDFAVFILTHGRPQRVTTFETLKRRGYTGKVYFVVDDEDKALADYQKRFGDRVLTFSKADIAARFDEGDNFEDRRSVFYARNACRDLALRVGVRLYMQLDDDYTGFRFRFNRELEYVFKQIASLDDVLTALIDYFEAIPALTIAMSQGGDHLGGERGTYAKSVKTLRKAMNTFLCSVDRPFAFVGKINEDVNTYALAGLRGELMLTILALQMNQAQTQANSGGMTELYKDSGTYVKSFYSVMYAPSCVKIADMASDNRRIHHKFDWNACAVKIIREEHRKPDTATKARARAKR